eukprot:gb/GECH01013159.1/.p1 GENE.gb/GECH01013159.1/~~gb/GECH01013159.1/.p1  ORF type:complete len:615 (+),score=193.85 gb/GECH01013159.1/:1-1845(+)
MEHGSFSGIASNYASLPLSQTQNTSYRSQYYTQPQQHQHQQQQIPQSQTHSHISHGSQQYPSYQQQSTTYPQQHKTSVAEPDMDNFISSMERKLQNQISMIRKQYEERLGVLSNELGRMFNETLQNDEVIKQMGRDDASAAHIQTRLGELVQQVLHSEQEECSQRLIQQVSAMNAENNELKRETEKLRKSLLEGQEAHKATVSEYESLREMYLNFKEKLNSLAHNDQGEEDEKSKKQIAALKTKLEQESKESKKLRKQLKDKVKTVKSAQDIISKLKEKLHKYKNRLEDSGQYQEFINKSKESIKKLQDAATELKEKNTSLEQQVENLKEQRIHDLENAANKYSGELKSLYSKVEEMQLRAHMAMEDKSLESTKALSEAKSDFYQQVSEYKNQVATLNHSLEEEKKEKENLTEEKKALSDELNSLKEKYDKASKDLNRKSADFDSFTKKAKSERMNEEKVVSELRRKLAEKDQLLKEEEKLKLKYMERASAKEKEISGLTNLLSKSYNNITMDGIQTVAKLENETQRLSDKVSRSRRLSGSFSKPGEGNRRMSNESHSKMNTSHTNNTSSHYHINNTGSNPNNNNVEMKYTREAQQSKPKIRRSPTPESYMKQS